MVLIILDKRHDATDLIVTDAENLYQLNESSNVYINKWTCSTFDAEKVLNSSSFLYEAIAHYKHKLL